MNTNTSKTEYVKTDNYGGQTNLQSYTGSSVHPLSQPNTSQVFQSVNAPPENSSDDNRGSMENQHQQSIQNRSMMSHDLPDSNRSEGIEIEIKEENSGELDFPKKHGGAMQKFEVDDSNSPLILKD